MYITREYYGVRDIPILLFTGISLKIIIKKGGGPLPDYRTLYYKLFAAAADALEAIEHANFGLARDILIRAQQNAETAWLDADDEKPAADR